MSRQQPPGRLDALLDSGELATLAQECRTQSELAQRLDITSDAITSWRRRREARGLSAPTFFELATGRTDRAGSTPVADEIPEGDVDRIAATESDSDNDFDQEPPTLPGIPLAVIPDRHFARGVSTLVDAEGNIKQQWIKTARNVDQLADMLEAFKAIKDELPQADEPQTPPSHPLDSRLLSTYLLGDCHVGMHAWRGDAGANFDLKIAERNLTEYTGRLVELAPSSEHALIVNIGDYFHGDNRGNTTTKGTPVDVDGRWSKVLEVGIRIMRRIIDSALQKHRHVTVINEIGNHDTHMSIFLSLALAQFYEAEPRVTIDTSPRMFHYYRFGKVLIMSHHGHNVKPRDLVGVLASDRAEDWGQTLFRYIYTGHIHHERSCEFPGAFWRSLRSPTTADAWHDSMGYRSGHELSLEIHDADRGLVNRHIIGVPADLGRAA